MKRLSLATIFLIGFMLIALQSCNVKRDCRGHIKHKLPNGIWI